MIILQETSFGPLEEKEEQDRVYRRVSPEKRGNCGVCRGKAGPEKRLKIEKEDKTAGIACFQPFWRIIMIREKAYRRGREEYVPVGASGKAGIQRTCCFSRSYLTTGKHLIWLSSPSITALFEAHHTLWITSIFLYALRRPYSTP
ncbi:MAG: hypothetical protein LBO67_08700 [Spirochaetaceae bacterium]|jgi:hypothetical protein|nr:hypothetical protein [Spirochaetaceae bacterium]